MAAKVIATRNEARHIVLAARAENKTVGVVPTMGSLHQGHLSLVKASASQNDFTAVTVFVNPTQFGPSEDLDRYPRDLEQDVRLLEGLGVDMIFAPNVQELYAGNFSTYVQPPQVAIPLEGAHRPGHFRGVATIVLKLFHIIAADRAYFGQKDFQQLRVIEDMVRDFDIPISIQSCPTVREQDGLAMSSRNAFLGPAERAQAVSLSQALKWAVSQYRAGQRSADVIHAGMNQLLREAGISNIDYVAIADVNTLEPVSSLDRKSVALIAAQVGKTRLIDNVRFG